MTSRRQFLQVGSGAIAAAQSRKPNFIVLFADDMGYGDLSCYGHPNIQTPNLDKLAAEGVRFTSGYAAASVCTPSRVGLLTGRYAKRAGLPRNLGPESVGGLPLSEITIAQHLKGHGYKTAAIGKWHIGHNPATYLPTSRGFDQYLGLLYSNDMIPPWVKTDVPLRLWRNQDAIENVTDQSHLTERYTNEATEFIRKAGENPFFLYLPYAMPHLPVSAPKSRRGRSRAGLYGDTIETLDWSVGQIMSELKARNLDGNTMVVFASDNGPWHELPPRMLAAGVEPWHTGSKSLFRGAKGTTWEGGHRVPFLTRWPGAFPGGRTSSEMVSTLDFFATFSAAAGAPMLGDRIYDSHDLMPLLRGRTAISPRESYHYFLGPELEGLREGPWKYRKGELYHLDLDPAEQYNVAARNPEVAARMASRLEADRVKI